MLYIHHRHRHRHRSSVLANMRLNIFSTVFILHFVVFLCTSIEMALSCRKGKKERERVNGIEKKIIVRNYSVSVYRKVCAFLHELFDILRIFNDRVDNKDIKPSNVLRQISSSSIIDVMHRMV